MWCASQDRHKHTHTGIITCVFVISDLFLSNKVIDELFSVCVCVCVADDVRG